MSRQRHVRAKNQRHGRFLLPLVAALLMLAPGVSAHEQSGDAGDHGTLEVETDSEACQVSLHVTNATHQTGLVTLQLQRGSLPGPLTVGSEEFMGEPDGDGNFTFSVGPFNATDNDFQFVVGYNISDEREEAEHIIFGDVFTMECPTEEDEPQEPEDPVLPPCPDITTAEARDDGNLLHWDAVQSSDGYRVYRAQGDGDFTLVHEEPETQGTGFVDQDVDAGVTYRYMVVAMLDGAESEGCEVVEITAIPFFPTVIGSALAMLGAIGAFALMRRRHA